MQLAIQTMRLVFTFHNPPLCLSRACECLKELSIRCYTEHIDVASVGPAHIVSNLLPSFEEVANVGHLSGLHCLFVSYLIFSEWSKQSST